MSDLALSGDKSVPIYQQIKDATARYLDIPVSNLRTYVVDRHETQNLTIRPQAVFG